MNKKLGVIITLIMAVSITITGCSQDAKVEEKTPIAEVAVPVAEVEVVSLAELGETPVLVTSFGQSADVAMLKALFTKVGVEIIYDPVVKADALGDAKTLFVAAGASTKGLGAAGIKPAEELERAEAIITAAKEKGMNIIAIHLGGSARRGDLSDKFVELAVKDSNGMIVVAEGNEDGYFTNISTEKSIPLVLVDSIAKGVDPLKEMFGKE